MDYKEILSLVLPSSTLEYFNINHYDINEFRVDLYLEEKSYLPDGYLNNEIVSHGFSREVMIQDFPFRDKSMYLHIKHRRYLIKLTGKTYNRDLSIVFKGTKITAEFAVFLKYVYH